MNKPKHMICPHCNQDWTDDFHVEEHGAVLVTLPELIKDQDGTVVKDMHIGTPESIRDDLDQYYFELFCDKCNKSIDTFGSTNALIEWVNEKEESND